MSTPASSNASGYGSRFLFEKEVYTNSPPVFSPLTPSINVLTPQSKIHRMQIREHDKRRAMEEAYKNAIAKKDKFLRESQKKISQLECVNQDISLELQEKKGSLAERDATIRQLKQNLDQKRKALSIAESQYADVVEEKETKMNEQSDRIATLFGNLKELRHVEQQRDELVIERDVLESRVSTWKDKFKECQTTLKQNQDELAGLRKLRNVQSIVTEQQQEILSLQSRLEKEQDSHAEVRDDFIRLHNEVYGQHERLVSWDDPSINVSDIQLPQPNTMSFADEIRMLELQEKLGIAEEGSERQCSEISSLKQELAMAVTEHVIEIAIWQADFKDANDSHDKHVNTMNKTHENKFSDQRTHYCNIIEQKQVEINKLTARNQKYYDEILLFQEQLNTLHSESLATKTKLSNENAILQNQVVCLEENLAQLQTEIKSNIAEHGYQKANWEAVLAQEKRLFGETIRTVEETCSIRIQDQNRQHSIDMEEKVAEVTALTLENQSYQKEVLSMQREVAKLNCENDTKEIEFMYEKEVLSQDFNSLQQSYEAQIHDIECKYLAQVQHKDCVITGKDKDIKYLNDCMSEMSEKSSLTINQLTNQIKSNEEQIALLKSSYDELVIETMLTRMTTGVENEDLLCQVSSMQNTCSVKDSNILDLEQQVVHLNEICEGYSAEILSLRQKVCTVSSDMDTMKTILSSEIAMLHDRCITLEQNIAQLEKELQQTIVEHECEKASWEVSSAREKSSYEEKMIALERTHNANIDDLLERHGEDMEEKLADIAALAEKNNTLNDELLSLKHELSVMVSEYDKTTLEHTNEKELLAQDILSLRETYDTQLRENEYKYNAEIQAKDSLIFEKDDKINYLMDCKSEMNKTLSSTINQFTNRINTCEEQIKQLTCLYDEAVVETVLLGMTADLDSEDCLCQISSMQNSCLAKDDKIVTLEQRISHQTEMQEHCHTDILSLKQELSMVSSDRDTIKTTFSNENAMLQDRIITLQENMTQLQSDIERNITDHEHQKSRLEVALAQEKSSCEESIRALKQAHEVRIQDQCQQHSIAMERKLSDIASLTDENKTHYEQVLSLKQEVTLLRSESDREKFEFIKEKEVMSQSIKALEQAYDIKIQDQFKQHSIALEEKLSHIGALIEENKTHYDEISSLQLEVATLHSANDADKLEFIKEKEALSQNYVSLQQRYEAHVLDMESKHKAELQTKDDLIRKKESELLYLNEQLSDNKENYSSIISQLTNKIQMNAAELDLVTHSYNLAVSETVLVRMTADVECDGLSSQVKLKENNLLAKDSHVLNLQEKIHTLDSDVSNNKEQLRHLNRKYNELKTKAVSLNKEKVFFKEKYTQVLAELKEDERELENKQKKIMQLAEDLRTSESKLQDQKSEHSMIVNEKISEISSLAARNHRDRNKMLSLEEKIHKMQLERDQSLNDFTAEKETLVQEIASMEEKCTVLQQNLKDHIQSYDIVSDLRSQNTLLKDNCRDYETTTEELRQQCESYKTQLDHEQEMIDEMNQKHIKAKNDYEALYQQLTDRYEQKIKALETQQTATAARCKQKIANLKQKQEVRETTYLDELKALQAKHMTAVQVLQDDIIAKDGEVQDMTTQCHRLQSQIKSLGVQLAASERVIQDYKRQLSTLNEGSAVKGTPRSKLQQSMALSWPNLSHQTPDKLNVTRSQEDCFVPFQDSSQIKPRQSLSSVGSSTSLEPNAAIIWRDEAEPENYEWDRINELHRRNSLFPPHMRTVYPVERTLASSDIGEDELRSGTFPTHTPRKGLSDISQNLFKSPKVIRAKVKTLAKALTPKKSRENKAPLSFVISPAKRNRTKSITSGLKSSFLRENKQLLNAKKN